MAMTTTQKYLMRNGGNRQAAVLEFTRDFMKEDPIQAQHAVSAAVEYWALSELETVRLEEELNADHIH